MGTVSRISSSSCTPAQQQASVCAACAMQEPKKGTFLGHCVPHLLQQLHDSSAASAYSAKRYNIRGHGMLWTGCTCSWLRSVLSMWQHYKSSSLTPYVRQIYERVDDFSIGLQDWTCCC